MGTNFYKIAIVDGKQTEGQHIGKRSAAGKYCHNCNVTLNIFGNFWVHQAIKSHYSSAAHIPPSVGFNLYIRDKSEKFPTLFPERYVAKKGKDGLEGLCETLKESENDWFLRCPVCGEEVKTTTCSFTWAIPPYEFYKEFLGGYANNPNWEKIVKSGKAIEESIIDEYGRTYNFLQFNQELKENKIHYYHSIGDEFC